MWRILELCVLIGSFLSLQDRVFGANQTISATKRGNVTMQSVGKVSLDRFDYPYAFFGTENSDLVRIDYKGGVSYLSSTPVTVKMNGKKRDSYQYDIYTISFSWWNVTEEQSDEYTLKRGDSPVYSWKLYVIDTDGIGDPLEAGTLIHVYDFPHLGEGVVDRMGLKERWSVAGFSRLTRYTYIHIRHEYKDLIYEITDDTGNVTAFTFELNVADDQDVMTQMQQLQTAVYVLCGFLAVTIVMLMAYAMYVGRKHISDAAMASRRAISSARERIPSFTSSHKSTTKVHTKATAKATTKARVEPKLPETGGKPETGMKNELAEQEEEDIEYFNIDEVDDQDEDEAYEYVKR